jgi:hypothetical protein
VPAPVFLRLLEPFLAEDALDTVAGRLGANSRALYRWRAGEVLWVRFETVDRLVCELLGDPALWYTDPELAAVAAQFDRAAPPPSGY